MRVLLNAPDRLRRSIEDTEFGNRIEQIDREWREWIDRHPTTTNGPRAPPDINNPAGEIIGSSDSEPPTQDGYDLEDPFIDDGDVVDDGDRNDDDIDDGDEDRDEELSGEEIRASNTEAGQDADAVDGISNPDTSSSQSQDTPRRPRKSQDPTSSYQSPPPDIARTGRTGSPPSQENSLDSDDQVIAKRVRKPPQLSAPPLDSDEKVITGKFKRPHQLSSPPRDSDDDVLTRRFKKVKAQSDRSPDPPS